MIGTGLAILGAGVLGAGATMYGASKAADAQKEAANAAAETQRAGMEIQKGILETQKQNYGQATGNLNPFIQSGQGANSLLAEAYGLSGKTALGQSSLEAFQNSPDYQWALKGGSQALDNSAAAKGGVLGGNQIRAQTEYGQGLATQNLQNYFARLSGMSGQGIQAGSILGQLGTNLGTGVGGQIGTSSNNIANSQMAAGTAEASGIKGMVGGFQQGLSSLSLYNQMGKSSYGGTGFSLSGTGGLY